MSATTPSPWVAVFLAIISGGGLKYLYDSLKDWRNATPSEIRKQSVVDASIVTVSRARDELEDDNTRIRKERDDDRTAWQNERDRYERERAAWTAERLALRSEIDALREQLLKEREESTRRYDRLLDRLADLSARHTTSENEAPK
jgi:chromosome segregation ATPase